MVFDLNRLLGCSMVLKHFCKHSQMLAELLKLSTNLIFCASLCISSSFGFGFKIEVYLLSSEKIFGQISIRESPSTRYPMRFRPLDRLTEQALRILRKTTWGCERKGQFVYIFKPLPSHLFSTTLAEQRFKKKETLQPILSKHDILLYS